MVAKPTKGRGAAPLELASQSPAKHSSIAKKPEAIEISEDGGDAQEDDNAESKPDSIEDTNGKEDFDPALLDEEETPDDVKKPASGPGWSGGGYDALKSYNGQVYSGMAIGGSHTWNYQPGVWKETKVEPDKWDIDFQTNKIRNHKAPVGSGAPVGTEYHWYLVVHQHVKKIDANTYETHMTGSKYKLTHKNVNAKNWDIPTIKGQRDREIFLLEDAKRRIEGLPPVLSTEKVKVDKKEKGQATLGSFFQASPPKKRKTSPSEDGNPKRMKS